MGQISMEKSRPTGSVLSGNQHRVQIEHRALGFPFTPAFVATRGHETVIVEVVSTIDRKRIERWQRYGMSQTVDTRVCVIFRSTGALSQEVMYYAHSMRIGLMAHDDKLLLPVRSPSDLAVHIALPNVADLDAKIRPVLAPAFEKFDYDWRDGLGEAYDEVEQQAREYLKEGISTGRVVIDKTKGGKVVGAVSSDDVEDMTLGALKNAFGWIQKRNYADETIFSTLDMINKTRVGLRHKKKAAAVEAQLRTEAGKHMYAVISCLEELAN